LFARRHNKEDPRIKLSQNKTEKHTFYYYAGISEVYVPVAKDDVGQAKMKGILGMNDLKGEKTPTVLLSKGENTSRKKTEVSGQDRLAVEERVPVPLDIHQHPARVAKVREEGISMQDLEDKIVPPVVAMRPQHLQGGGSQ